MGKILSKYLTGLLIFNLLGLSGCGYVEDYSKPFTTEKEAAINFFKDNISTLKALTPKQEMLGWVLKCTDGMFYFSEATVGGLSNSLNPSKVETFSCSAVANLHSHPKGLPWHTVDFFSEADIRSSYRWNMYLLSQENCNVRFGSSLKDRDGDLLGKLKFCK